MNRAQRVRKHATDPDLSKLETASTTSNDATPRKRPKTYSDDSSTENSVGEGGSEIGQPLEREVPVSDIELVFRPLPLDSHHNDVDSSQTRYIKTTANATGKYYQNFTVYDWSSTLMAYIFEIIGSSESCSKSH